MNNEQKAFMDAYGKCMAVAPDYEIEYFFANKDKTQEGTFKDQQAVRDAIVYWGHIEDAWLLWLEATKQKQPIGAYACIQFNDSDTPTSGAYFSFGDYLEAEEMDSYGIHDERIFYYAQGEHDLIALSKPNGGDFVVISYELEFQA